MSTPRVFEYGGLEGQLRSRNDLIQEFLNGEPLPEGIQCPTNWTQYQFWSVPSKNIAGIGSYSSVNVKQQTLIGRQDIVTLLEKGRELVERAKELTKRPKARRRLSNEVEELKRANGRLTLELSNLAAKYHETCHELKTRTDEVIRARALQASAQLRNDDLTRKFNEAFKTLQVVQGKKKP